MDGTIQLPVWLALPAGALAAASLMSHFILPGGRWLLRRRVDRVLNDLNARLDLDLPPFMLTKRDALIDRLVYDPKVQEAARESARARGVPQNVVMEDVKEYAREIVPGFNAYFYVRLGDWVASRFPRFFFRLRLAYPDENGLEKVRRDRRNRYYATRRHFRFQLGGGRRVPMIRWDIPSPAEVEARYGFALTDPAAALAPPERMPPVVESERVPGPAGQEYWLRFPSPAARMGDDVFARVFEPRGVGGSSLGALASQLLATRARDWPAPLRPDALFLVTHCGRLEDAAVRGALARIWGIHEAMRDHGWTDDEAGRWGGLVDPVGPPVRGAENVVTVLGRHDTIAPFDSGRALIDSWNVPARNRFVWRRGHFSVPLGLIRDHRPLDRLTEIFADAGTGRSSTKVRVAS